MRADEFFNVVRDAVCNDFHCLYGAGGVLEHRECHADGAVSVFRVRMSRKAVAFSLDKPGKDPFSVIPAGMNNRNDLTIVCLAKDGTPVVFVVECKNSGSPLTAQRQIECGMAFSEYLFKIIGIHRKVNLKPRIYGVVAYLPKSPPKGTTRPQFVEQGLRGILRAEWQLNVELPLNELVRATGLESS